MVPEEMSLGRRRLLGLGVVALSSTGSGCLDQIRPLDESPAPDETTTTADPPNLQVWNERSDDIGITLSVTAIDGEHEFSVEDDLEAGTRKAYAEAIPNVGAYRIEVSADGQTAEKNHEFVGGESLDIVVEADEIQFLEAAP